MSRTNASESQLLINDWLKSMTGGWQLKELDQQITKNIVIIIGITTDGNPSGEGHQCNHTCQVGPWGKSGGNLKQSIACASKKLSMIVRFTLQTESQGYPIVSVSIGRLPLRTAMHLRNMAAKIIGHPTAKSLNASP